MATYIALTKGVPTLGPEVLAPFPVREGPHLVTPAYASGRYRRAYVHVDGGPIIRHEPLVIRPLAYHGAGVYVYLVIV